MRRQDGVVLFIALIALVTIMLAAVALVRSVDTGNIIAGNIAFRRAATSSGDGGLESAISYLAQKDRAAQPKDPFFDPSHVLNTSAPAEGYYSNDNPALNLTVANSWTSANSGNGGTDASGNTLRFIIQRMCRTANQVLSETNCVFSDAESQTSSMKTGEPSPAKSGRSVLYRVTVRVTGPRNTISFIQGYIY